VKANSRRAAAAAVGVPLQILPVPEAPFVPNLLSFGAGGVRAVLTAILTVPRWLIWGRFFTIPWTLQFSTHVITRRRPAGRRGVLHRLLRSGPGVPLGMIRPSTTLR
jgi:hypothetical protein